MSEVVSTANQSNFYSRQEMLNWINDCLKLNEKKLESLGTGAIFCQLFDLIYPGKVQSMKQLFIFNSQIMNKVNWKAKYENEFVANFKVLQQAFDKMNVNKPIDVNKLIKCKYQDNLEFLQWMRKYHDQYRKNTDKPYDASSRRNGASTADKDTDKIVSHPNLQIIKDNASNNLDNSIHNSSKHNFSRNSYKKSQTHFVPSELGKPTSNSCQSSVSNLSDNEYNQLDEADTSKPLTQASKFQMDSLIQRLKDERNFYFSKIQSIDQMLDNVGDQNPMKVSDIKKYIKTILYSTQDQILTILDDGAVTLTDKCLNNIPTTQFEILEGLEQLKNEILNTDQAIKKSDKKQKKNIPRPYDSNQENKINLIPLPSQSYENVSKMGSQGFKTPNSSKYHYEKAQQQEDFSQSIQQNYSLFGKQKIKSLNNNQSLGAGQNKIDPLYEIFINDEKNSKHKSSFYEDLQSQQYNNSNYPGDLMKVQQVSELQLPNSDAFELNENLFESQDEDLLGNLEE